MLRLLTLIAFLFPAAAQAATYVQERAFGPYIMPDDVVEECEAADCFSSSFSDPRLYLLQYFKFPTPTGTVLRKAVLEYKFFFIGVGDFDRVRFHYVEIGLSGPGIDILDSDFSARVTPEDPIAVLSKRVALPVKGLTSSDFAFGLQFWADVSASASAAGRTIGMQTMRVASFYRLTYVATPLAPVPVPASGLVLVAALAGLAALRSARAAKS